MRNKYPDAKCWQLDAVRSAKAFEFVTPPVQMTKGLPYPKPLKSPTIKKAVIPNLAARMPCSIGKPLLPIVALRMPWTPSAIPTAWGTPSASTAWMISSTSTAGPQPAITESLFKW